ncbi:MAG: pyridoxamine 5'-phosphate oxidase [Casimicrobiaceae bacterium]|nr:pyridoxamine 5'-phosphate oxidase [Casimicrobiaceae bacterium]MDW8313248.1 pyridoxamine 5'-phosphate oxidase [Burkholderiales bacterium]
MRPSDAIADLRKEYKLAALDERDVAPDPITQFRKWLDEAIQAQLPEPTAMNLATVGADGRPSARIVLLKGLDERGFVFYTNYASRKGRELAERPFAALTFHWVELERQVRIEGAVEKVSAEQSDAYFASRPLASRLGALASPQSEPIPSREWLQARMEQVSAAYANQPEGPPRPAHWGGYRVRPEVIEFWQGRASRLHDRLCYRRSAEGWAIERLAP